MMLVELHLKKIWESTSLIMLFYDEKEIGILLEADPDKYVV